jgi:transposase
VEALKPRKGGAVPAPRKYSEELRERAIRFALDLVDGPERLSVNAACKRVGQQLGIVPDSLRNWVQQARIDAGNAPGLSSDERARLVELERENRELRRANAILKSASVNSSGQCNSAASLSAGVSKPRVLRGRELSLAAMASRSS